MSHFRNAIFHASGMQFVMLQECNLSRFRNAPKSCVHIRKFIFLSAVAALVVSLSQRQMAKAVMGVKLRRKS